MKKQQRMWLLLIIGLMIFHFLSLRVALLNGERAIFAQFETMQTETAQTEVTTNTEEQKENIAKAEKIDNETFMKSIKQHHARILNNHVITQLFLLLLLGTYIKKRCPDKNK
jgi:hypothetical protein